MKRTTRIVGFLLLFAPKAWGEPASRRAPPVSLLVPTPTDQVAAERLVSELLSEGYAVEMHPATMPSPCDMSAPSKLLLTTQFDGPFEARLWIRLGPTDEGAPSQRTFICYQRDDGRLLRASAHAPNGDVATLALSTVEALNGLRSDPVSAGNPEPIELAVTPPKEPAPSSLSAGASFAFLSTELRPLLGPRFELQAWKNEYFSIVGDIFATLRASEIERADRRIDLCLGWLRFGPRLSAPLSVFGVDVSLLGGPALVWTTAEARAPLVGSADSATVGMVSLGVGVEVPRRSALFLRVGARGSALVPSVTIETGDGETPAWLFVETSLGIGLRWSDAE